ncbi:MAG: hypothetical protein BGO11_01745 [Solirubrobacterales bacterium 70-9]|nr:MAG: hypothetical protein BGO11_01745 [Solirubrobacterales bacterium 70-9]
MRTITGTSLAASTIAQATRWVKEVFRPRSFSCALIALRFASSVSTAIVRNEVAVGTARLSSIALASIAAGPRSCFSSPAAAAGADPLPPFSPFSTSSLVTLPPKPVGVTLPRLIPCASATRRAMGVAFTSVPLPEPLPDPFPPAGGADGVSLPAACEDEGAPSATGPAVAAPEPSPASISSIGAPTGTSSSTSTRSLVTVPLTVAGTSASTLSVETSTTVSPSLTKSPTATCHSRTIPSVTDSPISGMAICTVAVSGISSVQYYEPGHRAAFSG